MIRDAISRLLSGETATVAGASVTRVGLIGYSVNGGPAVRLDEAVASLEALGSAVAVPALDELREAAVEALAQYRLKLPGDRAGLAALVKRLRKYPDAEPQAAAEAVEAVLKVVVEIDDMEAA